MPPPAPADAVDVSWSPSLQALIERGETRRYRKGTLLIEEGDQGDSIYMVLSGRLQVYSTDEHGREVVYGVYGPGEYLGEMSLDGGPRSASVVTLEPTSCTVVTRSTLREHIAANPEFAFELLARVIRRARLATQGLRRMALLDVYGRLAETLSELATEAEGHLVVRPRLTHAAMAQRVGCSREMVSRLMKDLTTGGYVEVVGNAWVLRRRLPRSW